LSSSCLADCLRRARKSSTPEWKLKSSMRTGGESSVFESRRWFLKLMSKSGFVSIVGRPNSGKSTLLNRVVGEKVSIVTDKPQTTRHVVRGIVNRPEGQITFLDTPGIHKPVHRMNERMMKSVRDAMADVDLILLIVDCSASFGHGDEFTLDLLRPIPTKKFLLRTK